MYLSFLSIQDTALVYQDKDGKVTMREECSSEGECKQVSHALKVFNILSNGHLLYVITKFTDGSLTTLKSRMEQMK